MTQFFYVGAQIGVCLSPNPDSDGRVGQDGKRRLRLLPGFLILFAAQPAFLFTALMKGTLSLPCFWLPLFSGHPASFGLVIYAVEW